MTIIAAVDLSPVSHDAARSAARLACKLGDRLLLVHVLEPASLFYPELFLAGRDDALDASMRKAASEAVESLRQSLSQVCPVETRLLTGEAAEALARCAQEEQARLIVMGTHGRGAAARLVAGSVAQRTVLEAPCPVLVLRAGAAPFDAWSAERPLRVVAGIDRTPASDAALAWTTELRKAGPIHLTLVHHYWPPAEYARLGLRGMRDIAHTDPEVAAVLERELRANLPELPGDGSSVLRIEADWGPMGESLARDAEAHDADLVIVGTHQPHGWNRVKTGSAALNTLHVARRPLLCVPARSHRQAVRPALASIPIIRSVLAATDLSELGNAVLPHAYSLVRAGGTVHLCHVRERGLSVPAYVIDDLPGALTPAARAALENRLREVVPPQAAEQAIATELLVIDGGRAADEILHAARRLSVDAIVLSSHGRSGVARAVRGSVAEAVLRASEVPVYVVRAREDAPGRG